MKIEVPDFQSDERGVSPVIGVILMVAITVILAAVIGAFVLDLGSQLGSTGPQSQISVSDADQALTSTGGENVFVMEHKGGDDLKTSELKVVVQQDGTTIATDNNLNTTAFDSGPLAWSSTSPSFTVGNTYTAVESGSNVTAGTYTIKVIHQPSNAVVTSTKVDLS